MSEKMVLLRRAQRLCREAREIRADAAQVSLSPDRECLTTLASLLEAEAVKLERRADQPAGTGLPAAV